jgi:hypothetical protein
MDSLHPDTPIFRIFKRSHLLEWLDTGNLTLVLPQTWDDPFEYLSRCISVRWRQDGQERDVVLNQDLPCAYAQCWTLASQSDVLWRAYSRVSRDKVTLRIDPDQEGVQVRTTVGKLIAAICSDPVTAINGQCFISKVRYVETEQIAEFIREVITTFGRHAFKAPHRQAEFLLHKRPPFSYEQEVRLVFIAEGQPESTRLFKMRVNPANVIDEISFDPRLISTERHEREAEVRAIADYATFAVPDLYQGVLWIVGLERPPSGE